MEKRRCANSGCENFLLESQIKKHSDAKYCSKKCCNADLFTKWKRGYDNDFLDEDNELSAYFTGLWVAEGHMDRHEGRISLSSSEKEIVDNIAKRVNYTNEMGPYSREDGRIDWVLRFGGSVSKNIEKMGYSWGPKTEREFIPERFINKFFSHFLRGFLDGDGSMLIRKNHDYFDYLCCQFHSASFRLLHEIYEKLYDNNIIRGGGLRDWKEAEEPKNMFTLSFAHFDSVNIGSFVYKDATIYLKRKRDNYDKLKDRKLNWEIQKGLTCLEEGCDEPAYSKHFCKSHFDKHYREENKEEIKARKKVYRDENKEKIKKHNDAYREENKGDINQRRREKYANDPEHKEKAKERARKRREEKRDEINAKKREKWHENKEETNAAWQERYATDEDFREKHKEKMRKYRKNNKKLLREAGA